MKKTVRKIPQKVSTRKRIGVNKILLGELNLYFNMKIILLGYYAMAYTWEKSNMSRRSIPGIKLRESNEYGVNLFMYL